MTETESTQLSAGDVRLLTYVLLISFGVLGTFAVPVSIRTLRNRGIDSDSKEASDFWYTARNSQGWPTIALSIIATSAGAWLLYTPGEAMLLGGWWALIGYSVAMFLAPLTIVICGPQFRDMVPDSANITDWVGVRYGPVVQTYVTIILVFYMFIYLVGQFKSMGDMVTMYSDLQPEEALLPMAIITLVYTMVGGLPASLLTDQIQAVSILSIICVIFVFLWGQAEFEDQHWAAVSKWTPQGFEMAVSLCFAIFGAEVCNLAFWQRVYVARDDRALKIGFLVGGAVISVLTFLFGISAALLKAQDLSKEKPTNMYPALIFFEINNMPSTSKAIKGLIFTLATCMIASCVDSFQIGITSVISRELQRREVSPKRSLLLGEIFVVMVNVPAIIFAVYAVHDQGATGLAVRLTDLFSMADVLTITLVVPIFAGLGTFVTRKGALLGMLSGILVIMIWGWFEFGTFMGGMQMITLMCFGSIQPTTANGQRDCGFYAGRAVILFPLLPIITGVVTYTVSWGDRSYKMLMKLKRHRAAHGITVHVPFVNGGKSRSDAKSSDRTVTF